jgi:hypothetical protein
MLRAALFCVLEEILNFKSHKSLQIWLIYEIIYTYCDPEQNLQCDCLRDPAEFTV